MRMQPPPAKPSKIAGLEDPEWNIVMAHLYEGQYKAVAGVIAKLSQQLLQQEFGNGPGELEPPVPNEPPAPAPEEVAKEPD